MRRAASALVALSFGGFLQVICIKQKKLQPDCANSIVAESREELAGTKESQ